MKSSRKRSQMLGDGGANRTIAGGSNCRVIGFDPIKKVDITGIDNHQLRNIRLCSVGFVVETQLGKAIAIIHNVAYMEHGHTISSGIQMRAHGCNFDDVPLNAPVPGKQSITTSTGYCIPMDIEGGLAYVNVCKYSDQEWLDLPHIELAGGGDWNPYVLDRKYTVKDMKKSGRKLAEPKDIVLHPDYDVKGNLANNIVEVETAKSISASKVAARAGFTNIDVNFYQVEGFQNKELPTFDINKGSSRHSSDNTPSDILDHNMTVTIPDYSTTCVSRAALRCCATGWED